MYTYFTAMKNRQGLPLTYVICKTPGPSGIFIDREQELIQNSPIQGNMFSCDTKKVLATLKDLPVDTDAETWMKGKRCSQEAMLALHNHNDRKSEGKRKKLVANNDPKRSFYRTKTTFFFEKYVTKMKQTFNVIENYNIPLYEEYKVRQLLNNINSTNNDLKTDVDICIYSHSACSKTAYKYLSTFISCLLPATQPSSGMYGWRRKINSAGRGGRGGRGGRFEVRGGRHSVDRAGRGGRGKININHSENGVDISDPTRWYGK